MTGIFNGVNNVARALDFHMERQNLIASNIANLDTPGFVPKEIERAIAGTEPGDKMAMQVTDGQHFKVGGVGAAADFNIVAEQEAVPGNDLNYVNIDREMARLSANSLRFDAVSKMVSRQLGMIRYAATNGGR